MGRKTEVRHKNAQGMFHSKMWAMQFAHSIRRTIPDSKPCRDKAIKAFLEVYLMVNPNFDDKAFREIANGTVNCHMTDIHYQKWRERYALGEDPNMGPTN